MKKLSLIITLALLVGILAGCAGTPVVYYTDCTCPVEAHEAPTVAEPVIPLPAPTEGPVAAGSAVKTGLAIVAGAGDSKSATAEENGEAKYDVTVVSVLVADNGVIDACIICKFLPLQQAKPKCVTSSPSISVTNARISPSRIGKSSGDIPSHSLPI